jgi:hypothetical protein
MNQIKKLLQNNVNSTSLQDGRKIFNKGLIARIYKELKKLTLQRINSPMNRWTNELSR